MHGHMNLKLVGFLKISHCKDTILGPASVLRARVRRHRS